MKKNLSIGLFGMVIISLIMLASTSVVDAGHLVHAGLAIGALTMIRRDTINQIRKAGNYSRGSGQQEAAPTGNILHPAAEIQLNDTAELLSANLQPYPDTVNVTVQSNPGAGAFRTSTQLFNADTLAPTLTNGSGANSITQTWDDNNGGTTVSVLLRQARGYKGAISFGFSVEAYVDAGSGPVAYPAGTTSLRPAWLTYDWQGRPIPLSMNAARDNTKQTFSANIAVVRAIQNVTQSSVLDVSINGDNAGNTYTLIFCVYFVQDF
jgi:hypothetical protein